MNVFTRIQLFLSLKTIKDSLQGESLKNVIV